MRTIAKIDHCKSCVTPITCNRDGKCRTARNTSMATVYNRSYGGTGSRYGESIYTQETVVVEERTESCYDGGTTCGSSYDSSTGTDNGCTDWD